MLGVAGRREDNLMHERGGEDSKANPFSSPLGAMFYSVAALLTRWDLPSRLWRLNLDSVQKEK